jgi:transcriptional regulator with XRE-family HTH domain
MKLRRDTLGISQLDLAEMAGISLATVKDIERGKGNPSLATVKKILLVLGLVIEYRIRPVGGSTQSTPLSFPQPAPSGPKNYHL